MRDQARKQTADTHRMSSDCGTNTERRLGDRVTLEGRAYELVGVTSMSVRPKRVFLKDLSTGQLIAVPGDALSAPEDVTE